MLKTYLVELAIAQQCSSSFVPLVPDVILPVFFTVLRSWCNKEYRVILSSGSFKKVEKFTEYSSIGTPIIIKTMMVIRTVEAYTEHTCAKSLHDAE